MTIAKLTGKQSTKGKARIRGIGADAETLGVSRQHLWAVLTERRTSRPLLARFEALKAAQAKAAKTINRTKN